MSLLIESYNPPISAMASDYNFSDLDFDNLDDPRTADMASAEMARCGNEGMVDDIQMGSEGSDQNDWMKVFVPSLLLAGFPRQMPSLEIQSPTAGASSASNNMHIISQQPIPPVPITYPASFGNVSADPPLPYYPNPLGPSAHFETPLLQSNIPQAPAYPTYVQNSTSPPLTLSTLRYPFQTLDLYAPSYTTMQYSQQQQQQPDTPSCGMMQYLNFPDTPGLPNLPVDTGYTMGDEMGMEMGMFGVPNMAMGTEVPPQAAADAWDIFRTPIPPLGGGEYQAGSKRKRGRPRCTFTRDRPLPQLTPASSDTSTAASETAARIATRDEQIKTQVALEAELTAAVEELNGRVRGILGRATPDVVRGAGVSAVLQPEDQWGSAKAIISKVIGTPVQSIQPLPEIVPMELDFHTPPVHLPPVVILPQIRSKDHAVTQYKGPWMPHEISKLGEIVARSREVISGEYMVNWTVVIEEFGASRSKHQILCKAVDLGLKGTTTTVGRRKKQKQHQTPVPSKSGRSVSASGEDGDAESMDSCTTATSVTSSL